MHPHIPHMAIHVGKMIGEKIVDSFPICRVCGYRIVRNYKVTRCCNSNICLSCEPTYDAQSRSGCAFGCGRRS